MPIATQQYHAPANQTTQSGKHYVAFVMSDGDNAQYVQRAMRKIWDQNASSRGIYPLNWTIALGMVDLGPALLNYYYTTATTKDSLRNSMAVNDSRGRSCTPSTGQRISTTAVNG